MFGMLIVFYAWCMYVCVRACVCVCVCVCLLFCVSGWLYIVDMRWWFLWLRDYNFKCLSLSYLNHALQLYSVTTVQQVNFLFLSKNSLKMKIFICLSEHMSKLLSKTGISMLCQDVPSPSSGKQMRWTRTHRLK